MENVVLIFFVTLTFFAISGKVKHEPKNFFFLLFLISIAFFFFLRLVSEDIRGVNFLILMIGSIISIIIGYFSPHFAKKFISEMDTPPHADNGIDEKDD